MVFAGQDKWRSHPLLAECYKRPLPGIKTAVFLFGVYLAFDYVFTRSQRSIEDHSPKLRYKQAGFLGEHTPELTKAKKSHH
eukprot:gene41580-50743_t